ncbi:MAG: hypothetical protein OEU92_07210 [Alphaproteobacteria bacterium]|nr:hypothetical protein [Alphaproteobacteria bacterium]
MNDQMKKDSAAPGAGISEAERMAKIRELLVGPIIADESARVDQSVGQLAKQQEAAIAALQARIQELEDSQRIGMKRLQTRLLGIVEALLVDEEELRSRLRKSEALLPKLHGDRGNGGA